MPVASLQERFKRAAALPGAEFELALLVAEVIDAQIDLPEVRRMFDVLAEAVEVGRNAAPQALLDAFTRAGFGASAPRETSLQHSHLGWVMENRQGIPISLAALLIESARRQGLACHGINYPGHFLVSVADQLVDPLRMKIVDPAELADQALEARALQPATPMMFGLRMLNNLKAFYMHAAQWPRVLDVLDYQLAIVADDAALASTLQYEQGECWERLGAFAVAADAFRQCAAASPHEELSTRAETRARELAARGQTLH